MPLSSSSIFAFSYIFAYIRATRTKRPVAFQPFEVSRFLLLPTKMKSKPNVVLFVIFMYACAYFTCFGLRIAICIYIYRSISVRKYVLSFLTFSLYDTYLYNSLPSLYFFFTRFTFCVAVSAFKRNASPLFPFSYFITPLANYVAVVSV